MATKDDAMLVIEFSRWAKEWGFYEANSWLRENRDKWNTYEVFRDALPPSSEGYHHVHTVLGFYENLGLFYRHRVIDTNLLFDWLDFVDPWSRLAAVALGLRDDAENPDLWTNFELLARDQRGWLERRDAHGTAT